MPSLTVKGLPDPLYKRLKARAAVHRRSLNSEILTILEDSVAARRLDIEDLLAEARALRQLTAATPLADEEIKAAIARGRR